jgi:hypothetical protein
VTYAAIYVNLAGHNLPVKLECDVMLGQKHYGAPLHIEEYEIRKSFPTLSEEEENEAYQIIDHSELLTQELLAQAEDNYDPTPE